MAYYVDRVVICDAFKEPQQHYKLLAGGRSQLVEGRRPSMRILEAARSRKGGVDAQQGALIDDSLSEAHNAFVNQLREELGSWRASGYPGTAGVTRRLLEWWFERDEERLATGRRPFFCQQEAVEAVIYLYEVRKRHRMPETGDLLRYALKMATGTGKTILMALIVVWSTLHKAKVSGSGLSANFLVLVPNLTVLDRVAGTDRGDGLVPAEHDVYTAFDLVPPEYADVFSPNVRVRNWQGISFEERREDWIPDPTEEEGRFVPASVLWAMRRRRRGDATAPVRRMLEGWRDVVILNDEAHHAWGRKRARDDEEPQHIKWSRIIDQIAAAVPVPLVVDVSATPWYGVGSPKPQGTLFEWLVTDFSVYDAFESGLVKVVRLPDPGETGAAYIDLWDDVRQARTKQEYLAGCRGAIQSLYASWKESYLDWERHLSGEGALDRGPSPVMLLVADRAQRAQWLFEYVSRELDLLRNPDDDDPSSWFTIRIDSKVFDADKGREGLLRRIVNTVGRDGEPGGHVRCVISVQMLSEGWDVRSVTHILGLRAFGSALLTEQVIGRGLRRTSYDVLNQPLDERPPGSEETVDALGIPFVGFPVERRRRSAGATWGHKPVAIEADERKARHRVVLPNVRAWGIGVASPLAEVIDVGALPRLEIDPKLTPPIVEMRTAVGGVEGPRISLESFREEHPLLRSVLAMAAELQDSLRATDESTGMETGPTFEELERLVRAYVEQRVEPKGSARLEDIGIVVWRQRVLDTLLTAIQDAGAAGAEPMPILGEPGQLDSGEVRRFQWTGLLADGAKSHWNRVPCHSPLEQRFADFLDAAPDVRRYLKNERLGFSVTYFDQGRARRYYPDFVVEVEGAGGDAELWLAEPKGEIRPNTMTKVAAGERWCDMMTRAGQGSWRFLFVPQRPFERAVAHGARTFAALAAGLAERPLAAEAREDGDGVAVTT